LKDQEYHLKKNMWWWKKW